MKNTGRYERIALYCETRVEAALTQDAREMWIVLADAAWSQS
jgi:hypothetical protein